MDKLRQFHLADPALFSVGHAPIAVDRYHLGAGSPAHGHDYVEIGLMVQGQVTDFDGNGERTLRRGDGYVIRPGGWHGNHLCKKGVIYNCCIAADLLNNHVAWARNDPRLDYLLFTGPAASQNRGILRFRLDEAAMRDCETHLDELRWVRMNRQRFGWLDEMSRLCVFLAALARGVRRQFGAKKALNEPTDPRPAGLQDRSRAPQPLQLCRA